MQTRNFALNIGLLFFAQLMALQSRFGTDERFRMDSRFLEEDEEVKEEDAGETVDAGTVAGKCRKVDQDGETPCFFFFLCAPDQVIYSITQLPLISSYNILWTLVCFYFLKLHKSF